MKRSTESQIQNCIDRHNAVEKISGDYMDMLVNIQVKTGHLSAYMMHARDCEKNGEMQLKRQHEEHFYEGLIELAAECIRAMERITE